MCEYEGSCRNASEECRGNDNGVSCAGGSLIITENPETPQADVALNDGLVVERKAKAFDWFMKEMMDEELKVMMEKGGYKTPLEAVEKAMSESN